VKLLIDSHVLLWWLTDNPRLSYDAEAAITDPVNEIFVSSCVAYELAYKQNIGRLSAFPENLPRRLIKEGMEVLPINLDHALAAAQLPGPHRDPWDRIMMAQATIEHCHMVTVDPVFAKYGVPVIW
jgi:PIN domain nuclease of toxin-antitoxin system